MGDYKQDRWINGHGVLRGREAFIRKNVSLYEARQADYPTLLLVALVYHEVSENGLPASGEELQRLDQSEELVADHFCARFDARFALCVTTNGTRDVFLFLPVEPTEQEVAAEFNACPPTVDYDFCLRNDPAWRPFMKMLPQAGTAGAKSPWWKRLFGRS